MEKQAITEQDVVDAQSVWGEGIIAIGKMFLEKGDYKARATQHIKDLYAYDHSDVLFKPTLASNPQFRPTFEQALSYFVGGDIPEDNGFAIKPWSKVRFGEQQILIYEDNAVAMGNYFFTPVEGNEEVKLEYTIGYIRDETGKLRINLHHSSVPYSPSSEE
ncbi:MAG: hypothetical protein HRT87_05510 [Legionellales bacterium]|nr:hypothetical protein [Legionellales bacterium]